MMPTCGWGFFELIAFCVVILFPNAKINIGLNIVGVRPDGYHDIESVFIPIRLCDSLEIAFPEDQVREWTLGTTGNPVAVNPEKNLCVKALNALKAEFEIPPVALHLHKVIPDGAGLGGGSSDAAFVLRGLSDLLKLEVPSERLQDIAAKIGADCPFFIEGRPVYCTGIGDVMEPVELPELSGMRIVVVVPNGSVSTAEAYANMPVGRPAVCVRDAVKQSVGSWVDVVSNDFEPFVASRIPDVARFKATLYDKGAIYAQMSGSGSSVFGLFDAANGRPLPEKSDFPGARCFWSGVIDS